MRRGLCERGQTIDVALYLSFFPHLVAGPIVRAREFLPQLATPRDPKDVAVGSGVFLIGLGLVKKVVLADLIARNLVDPVYAVPEAYGSADTMLALYGYAAQIYCDFSGYTDIAIGLALLMGFVFPRNFDRPYSSTQLPRVLAPLAHDALALPARLHLHPAGRQPEGPAARPTAT